MLPKSVVVLHVVVVEFIVVAVTAVVETGVVAAAIVVAVVLLLVVDQGTLSSNLAQEIFLLKVSAISLPRDLFLLPLADVCN